MVRVSNGSRVNRDWWSAVRSMVTAKKSQPVATHDQLSYRLLKPQQIERFVGLMITHGLTFYDVRDLDDKTQTYYKQYDQSVNAGGYQPLAALLISDQQRDHQLSHNRMRRQSDLSDLTDVCAKQKDRIITCVFADQKTLGRLQSRLSEQEHAHLFDCRSKTELVFHAGAIRLAVMRDSVRRAISSLTGHYEIIDHLPEGSIFRDSSYRTPQSRTGCTLQ
jgi:hypothetical protein